VLSLLFAGIVFSGCDLIVDYKEGPSDTQTEKRLVSESIKLYANCVLTDVLKTKNNADQLGFGPACLLG
jgi:hypothetical protein